MSISNPSALDIDPLDTKDNGASGNRIAAFEKPLLEPMSEIQFRREWKEEYAIFSIKLLH